MPTYIQKAALSDVNMAAAQSTRVMSPGTETASTYGISIAASGPNQNVFHVTNQGQINSDSWASGGTMTIEIRYTAATNMRARVRITRIDRDGDVLQTGALSALQTLNTPPNTKTFLPVVPTWTAAQEACGNRLVAQLVFSAQIGSSPASATIEVGTADSEVVSTITENDGNCRIINVT
jgi:hypothetical protein